MVRKRQNNFDKRVRKIALDTVKKQSETKLSTFGEENVQLYHHVPYFHSNMLYTTTGTDGGTRPGTWTIRVGNELFLQSLSLRMWLSNKQDRPNCIYRVMLFWYNAGEPLNNAAVLDAANNLLLNRPNRENISVITDKYVKNVSDSTAGKEHSTLKFINKSWKNKKIIYNDTIDLIPHEPKKRDIGFMVLCYDAYGTLTTDNIASMAYQYDVKYKEN